MQNILLYTTKMEALARRIAAVDSTITLGRVDWGHFPDGFPNMFVHDVAAIKRSNVILLASFEDPAAYRDQMWLLRHLVRKHPAKLQLVLPYFPTGTMERSDTEGQVATAAGMADDITSLGDITLVTFDLHALQIMYYFGKNVDVVLKSMAKSLKEEMLRLDAPAIVFPDDGAAKRFGAMFRTPEGNPLFPAIVCGKVRDGDRRIVTIKDGDPKGLDCVIYDDLTHSGGTAIECARALTAAGAASVSVGVTHGVMENDNWRKFEGLGLRRVYLSDSCPATVEAVAGNRLFQVLSLAPSIARAVRY